MMGSHSLANTRADSHTRMTAEDSVFATTGVVGLLEHYYRLVRVRLCVSVACGGMCVVPLTDGQYWCVTPLLSSEELTVKMRITLLSSPPPHCLLFVHTWVVRLGTDVCAYATDVR